MRRKQTSILVLAGITAFISLGLFWPGLVGAGDLEPPGPPGSTMKTLDQVEPRIPITSLPYTISNPGSYYLTGDLTSTSDGIIVNADNVSIDLVGHSLIGPGKNSGTNYGIYMDTRSNVEIRNGTVRDFGSDGILEGNFSAKAHRVISVRLISNGGRGAYVRGRGSFVKDCTAAENGDVGIDVFGYGSIVTGNIAYNNEGSGIHAGQGCTVTDNNAYSNTVHGIDAAAACTVTGNTVYSNQDDGIHSSSLCIITGNTAFQNQDDGIYAFGSCKVSGNTANTNNGYGISADAGSELSGNIANYNNQNDSSFHAGIRVNGACLLKGNAVSYNKQKNIYVYSSGNVIEGNLVTDSTIGIFFQSIGNFYTNNRASGNATSYSGSVPTGSGDGGGNVEF